MTTAPINIFIAYAREDEPYLNELRAHLRIMERNRKITIWYDGKIIAGEKFNEAIEAQLEQADIFLMLLSADFMNSDYAYGKEMKAALERHERGEATIIPIIARDCAWELTPLAELQAPVQGKALSSVNAEQRQSLYKSIVLDLNEAVQQRQQEKNKLRRYFNDEKAWKNALQLNSINAFNRYLEQHPQGSHAVEARRAIERIQQRQAKEKASIEQNAWREAKRLHTTAAFQNYLRTYPNGTFATEAKAALEAIAADQVQQAKAADRAAFQRAKKEHTSASYQQYLDDFPAGAFRKQAERALKRLAQPPKADNSRRIALGILVLLLGIVTWQVVPFFRADGIDSSDFPIPEMVKVEGGTFTMGCLEERDGNCDDREEPAHEVKVEDFYIGKYEVTVGEYLAFVEATKSNYPQWLEPGSKYHIETGTNDLYKKLGYSRKALELPIIGVSWDNAVAYCKWLSQQTNKTYRLPSEAEWEFAARGGIKSENYKYAGSNTLNEVAWNDNNLNGKPQPVGRKKTNELGLYDMSGNVWEWCQDCWHENYKEAPDNSTPWLNTKNGNCSRRVVRGGSWYFYYGSCRVAYRSDYSSDYRNYSVGFRVSQS